MSDYPMIRSFARTIGRDAANVDRYRIEEVGPAADGGTLIDIIDTTTDETVLVGIEYDDGTILVGSLEGEVLDGAEDRAELLRCAHILR